MEIEGRTTTFDVVGDEFNLMEDGILGLPFLGEQGVKIDFKNKNLTLGNKSFKFQEEIIRIPKRCVHLVHVKVINAEREGYIPRCDIAPGVYLGDAVVTVTNGKACMYAYNTTDEEHIFTVPYIEIEKFTEKLNEATIYSVYQGSAKKETRQERADKILEIIPTEHLGEEELEMVRQNIWYEPDIYILPGEKLQAAKVPPHRIRTTDDIPINVKQYRMPHNLKDELKTQIQSMLDADIIEPSDSPYSSPVWIVPKKPKPDGSKNWRLVIDFRKLNDKTIPNSYPLPDIRDILDQLGGATYFSVFDLDSGFHQIPLAEEDKHKTAFSVPMGHYHYKRMAMGLKGAPPTFQGTMECVLSGLQGEILFVYMDDGVIYGRSLEEHRQKYEKFADRLKKVGMKLKPSKCEFLRREVTYLGHIISADGVKPNPTKVEAAERFKRPTNEKKVREFLGLAGYYRRFIKNFAGKAKPLTDLLKKDTPFVWEEAQENAFKILKKELCEGVTLQYPDFKKPFIVTTDASEYAVGAILSQGKLGEDRAISYASRAMSAAERNYNVTKKELLAIMYAIETFRPYIYGRNFTLVTDHQPLAWLKSTKSPGEHLRRWVDRLEEYNYTVVHRSGKSNSNADALSRNPVRDENGQLLPVAEVDMAKRGRKEDTAASSTEQGGPKKKVRRRKRMLKGKNQSSDDSTFDSEIENESHIDMELTSTVAGPSGMQIEKRKRGRPKGSKNKPKITPRPQTGSNDDQQQHQTRSKNAAAKSRMNEPLEDYESDMDTDSAPETLGGRLHQSERERVVINDSDDEPSETIGPRPQDREVENRNDLWGQLLTGDPRTTSTDDSDDAVSMRSEVNVPEGYRTDPEEESNVKYTRQHVTDVNDNFVFFLPASGDINSDLVDILLEMKWINMGNIQEDNLEKGDVLMINKRKRWGFGMIYAANAIGRTDEETLDMIVSSLKQLAEQKQCKTLRMPTGIELLSKTMQAYYVSRLRETFLDTEIKIILCSGKLEVPKATNRRSLIRDHHTSAVGGHKGMTKTYRRIRSQFYWRTMQQDVRNYIKTCFICQQRKLVRVKPRKPMVITDTPETAFEKISMDIYGPREVTRQGYRYILTVQDLLTKFAIAIPLKHQEAGDVAKALAEKVICLFGAPQAILTDQGTNFMSETMRTLCKLFKIRHLNTTAYHPQSNGSIERSHHSLTEYLRTFIDQNREWDDWLDFAMFSYNTSVHEATNYTPHELVFGRTAIIPSEFSLGADTAGKTYHDYLTNLVEMLETTQRLARTNLENAKRKSKEYYDRNTKERVFEVGMKVWLLKEPRADKMKFHYEGPYEITRVCENNNVEINVRGKLRVVHQDKIKLTQTAPDSESEDLLLNINSA